MIQLYAQFRQTISDIKRFNFVPIVFWGVLGDSVGAVAFVPLKGGVAHSVDNWQTEELYGNFVAIVSDKQRLNELGALSEADDLFSYTTNVKGGAVNEDE